MFLRHAVLPALSKTQREMFTAHATAQLLSQFLHGEQGALMTAAAVTHAVPDYEAKLYWRHADHGRGAPRRGVRALRAQAGIVYPISPWLKELIDARSRPTTSRRSWSA